MFLEEDTDGSILYSESSEAAFQCSQNRIAVFIVSKIKLSEKYHKKSPIFYLSRIEPYLFFKKKVQYTISLECIPLWLTSGKVASLFLMMG